MSAMSLRFCCDRVSGGNSASGGTKNDDEGSNMVPVELACRYRAK
jgi:hypothetical protein